MERECTGICFCQLIWHHASTDLHCLWQNKALLAQKRFAVPHFGVCQGLLQLLSRPRALCVPRNAFPINRNCSQAATGLAAWTALAHIIDSAQDQLLSWWGRERPRREAGAAGRLLFKCNCLQPSQTNIHSCAQFHSVSRQVKDFGEWQESEFDSLHHSRFKTRHGHWFQVCLYKHITMSWGSLMLMLILPEEETKDRIWSQSESSSAVQWGRCQSSNAAFLNPTSHAHFGNSRGNTTLSPMGPERSSV